MPMHGEEGLVGTVEQRELTRGGRVAAVPVPVRVGTEGKAAGAVVRVRAMLAELARFYMDRCQIFLGATLPACPRRIAAAHGAACDCKIRRNIQKKEEFRVQVGDIKLSKKPNYESKIA
jgi:hypothetical protein